MTSPGLLQIVHGPLMFYKHMRHPMHKLCCAGKLGEHPVGVPNNLVPWLQKVALGQCEALSVYGNDYPTRDGTCIRDYTHVMDIVQGHIAALEKLFRTPDIGCVPINLGRGSGTTVLELIKVAQ